MEKVKYTDLSINERINLRSGFDIAVAHESGKYNRFNKCVKMSYIIKSCCQQQYDIDRVFVSLRTKLQKNT